MGTKALSYDIFIVYIEVILYNTVSFYFLSSPQLKYNISIQLYVTFKGLVQLKMTILSNDFLFFLQKTKDIFLKNMLAIEINADWSFWALKGPQKEKK